LGEKGGSWHVAPRFVQNPPVLFSGGVGNNIMFERAFARQFQGVVHLYDPSPTGLATWQSQIGMESTIYFHPLALTCKNDLVKMSPPKSRTEGSWTYGPEADGDVFTGCMISQEIQRFDYHTVDVVKLDIEGFEYEVLVDLLESGLFVGQILVEFHDFFPNIPKYKTTDLKKRLKSKDYLCFYKQRFDHSYIHKSLLKSL
jgi:FkbM family methyltransferase